MQDLLRIMDTDDLQFLSELLSEHVEPDASITPILDEDDGADRLLVLVGRFGLELAYPFRLGELWNTLDELEADVEADLRQSWDDLHA